MNGSRKAPEPSHERIQKGHISLLSTFHWPELCHVILSRHKVGWEMWFFFMPKRKGKHMYRCLTHTSHCEVLCTLSPILPDMLQLNTVYVLSPSQFLEVQYWFFSINLFIYLFLAALGLHCCAQAFSSCDEQRLLFVAVHGLQARRLQQLWLLSSRAQAQQLWHMGLVALRHVGSSRARARTRVPCIGRQILNHCTTREALQYC